MSLLLFKIVFPPFIDWKVDTDGTNELVRAKNPVKVCHNIYCEIFEC